MEYREFIKKLDVPLGHMVPESLTTRTLWSERSRRALGHWLAEELPFKEPYYSNREVPAG